MTALREVEETLWPFVISVVPPDPDVAFFERFFQKQMELAERKSPWVHLVDVRFIVRLPDAKVRNLIAENTKRMAPLARYNQGTALVMKSSLARGMLTAIHWISPPAYPFASVGTPPEGVEYLRDCLRKAQLPIPSGMGADLVEIVAARLTTDTGSAARAK